MSEMGDMTREERNLLLFLETQLVDHNGQVAGECMNENDFVIARDWTATTFVKLSRIPFDDMPRRTGSTPRTHRVQFSDEAWRTAHKLRRERGERHVETLEQGKDGT